MTPAGVGCDMTQTPPVTPAPDCNPFARQLRPLKEIAPLEALHQAPLPPLHNLSDASVAADSRAFHLICQSVHVIALSGPAITASLASRPWLSLIHVESGEVDLLHPEHSCACSAGDWLLVPGCAALWKSTAFNVVCVMVSPPQICRMLLHPGSGPEPSGSLELPNCPRRVHFNEGEVGAVVLTMMTALLQATGQLHHRDPQVLEQLDIGGQLRRLMAVLIGPMLLQPADQAPNQPTASQLSDPFEQLIAYIQAHLDQPLNLTVLANQSHYSRRALQYAFRDRLGCTPTQWIRSQRLDLARQRLLGAQPGDTVTRIAQACGYRSLSLFSIEFQQRFHVKPSVLLRQTRSLQDGDAAEDEDGASPG